MRRFAIDIVLLPSKEFMNTVIGLNRKLTGTPQKIQLHPFTCYPHISLAMGVMEEGRFANISKELKEIAGSDIPRTCTAISLREDANPSGEIITSLEVERTRTLLNIHGDAMEIVQKYCSYDADLDSLYPKPPPEEVTFRWINSYPTEFAYEKFWPHITLGTGMLNEGIDIFPAAFEIESLSLCHLGNYCTCREILADCRRS
jgi:hypothetical protein